MGRLIPARAGKTTVAAVGSLTVTAHPRAGGENSMSPRRTPCTSGSSPRGRGKLVPGHKIQVRLRLIPARAGKTQFDVRLGPIQAGSSPRGRGKPVEEMEDQTPERLIPARAGKTSSAAPSATPTTAHPRAGGENSDDELAAGYAGGSSPRGRGKHFLTCAFIERIGQILETLELAVSSGSYSLCDVYATDAPRDPARSIGLVLPSSRGAS